MTKDKLTYDLVRSRFISLLNRENSPRSNLITATYLLASEDKLADIKMRPILKYAGYAASTFYRLWPDKNRFLLDAYLHCVTRYIESEISFAREFSGNDPREYFEYIAQHTVFSQQYIHRDFFRLIAGQLAKGDYSKLLVHMESQVKRNLEVFVEKFPGYAGCLNLEGVRGLMWAVSTFTLVRNYDDGLKVVSDSELVDLIADAYLAVISHPRLAGSEKHIGP